MVVKKKKGNSSKKKRLTEFDKVFKETIEYWDGLVSDVNCEIYQIIGAMNLTEGKPLGVLPEFNDEDLTSFIKVVKRSIENTQSKIEELQGSISSVGIIKPIDETEAKVIGALRTLRFSNSSDSSIDMAYKSLTPLITLAEKEGFSFPDWIKDRAGVPKDE